jgi:hypothetical protein
MPTRPFFHTADLCDAAPDLRLLGKVPSIFRQVSHQLPHVCERRERHDLGDDERPLLSIEEACSRYMLTIEELLSWQSSIDQHGLAGLRTTRIQQYRM